MGAKAVSLSPKISSADGTVTINGFPSNRIERAVDSYLLGTEIMNVLVEYIQQDIGLCIGVISVGNLIEKLGMALGNIRIIPLLALHKFQIDEPKSANDFDSLQCWFQGDR